MSERKLTQQQAEEIRKARQAGVPRPVLAARFNICKTTIRRIERDQSYKATAEQIGLVTTCCEVAVTKHHQNCPECGRPISHD